MRHRVGTWLTPYVWLRVVLTRFSCDAPLPTPLCFPLTTISTTWPGHWLCCGRTCQYLVECPTLFVTQFFQGMHCFSGSYVFSKRLNLFLVIAGDAKALAWA